MGEWATGKGQVGGAGHSRGGWQRDAASRDSSQVRRFANRMKSARRVGTLHEKTVVQANNENSKRIRKQARGREGSTDPGGRGNVSAADLT